MTQPHEIAPAGWLGPLGAWLANVAAYLRQKKVTSQR